MNDTGASVHEPDIAHRCLLGFRYPLLVFLAWLWMPESVHYGLLEPFEPEPLRSLLLLCSVLGFVLGSSSLLQSKLPPLPCRITSIATCTLCAATFFRCVPPIPLLPAITLLSFVISFVGLSSGQREGRYGVLFFIIAVSSLIGIVMTWHHVRVVSLW